MKVWMTLGILGAVFCSVAGAATDFQSLQGAWRFALDPEDQGVKQAWYLQRFADAIHLPGTTDEYHKGPYNEKRESRHLTRVYPYAGAAWYQYDFNVPSVWQGRRVVLVLERSKATQLWLDDQCLGQQNSLVAPHRYDLGSPLPGLHTLTLRISNNEHTNLGDPHQISDETQTNWNGVIGRVGLEITDPVWIEDVQVYPEIEDKSIRVHLILSNRTQHVTTSTVTLKVAHQDARFSPAPVTTPQVLPLGDTEVDLTYNLGPDAQLWSEFTPQLYTLTVTLASGLGECDYSSSQHVRFGLREFKAEDAAFKINGQITFLRGTHDACVFPWIGYSPMNEEEWMGLWQTFKSYGLNTVRFHTWCPPEAAFAAADVVGLYLQPELPNWATFGDAYHDAFCKAEGERILKAFGNHPSFISLALGNELSGEQRHMAQFIRHFKSLDGRHLYAQGSNNWFGKPHPDDDYWASFQANWKHIRGSYGCVDRPLGHIQAGPANTDMDYGDVMHDWPVPVVSFEVGQYQVAPDLREIDKYTGVVQARNFELYRERLESQGMLDQAHDFFRASGALSAICYREEFEAALRTRGFDGIRLLDLKDFPGQGTALVGMLNAFGQSKGFITPEKWRQFCCETVPLVRMAKYTWTQSESFIARVQVAHYGPRDLEVTPTWTLRNEQGGILQQGELSRLVIPTGGVTDLDDLSFSLARIEVPSKISLELSLSDTEYRNTYPLWVYPDQVTLEAGEVQVERKLDESTLAALEAGARVLLLPEPNDLRHSLEGMWSSDFWNYGMFNRMAVERGSQPVPGTVGFFCDPNHALWRGFPTEFHSDWQWFNLIQHSRAMILDDTPADYRPLLQNIDTFERCHKLGTILEAKVGQGHLLICTIDLMDLMDHPEARQLYTSILHYMNSDVFAPQTSFDKALLASLFDSI